jgi:RNA polymerase sigma factor (sigma-70 family)
MNFAAKITSASIIGETLFGKFGGPIRHEDESEEYNDQRLLRQLDNLLREIDRSEKAARVAYIQSAYYSSHTSSGESYGALARKFEDHGSRLRAEFAQVRALLHTRRRGRTWVSIDCLASGTHTSKPECGEPLNHHERSWTSRLLKLSATSNLITIDDLRVALPERVFRVDSFPRILCLLDFLELDIEIGASDKFSLRAVHKFAYQKAEPTVENVSAAFLKMSAIEVKLKELVICDEVCVSQTLKILNSIVDGKSNSEDALMSPAPVPGGSSWSALLDLVSALERSQLERPLSSAPKRVLEDYRLHSLTLLRRVYDLLRFRPSTVESIAKSIICMDTRSIASLLEERQAIRRHIVEMHLRNVLTTCPSYLGNGLDLADLFQEGCRGLMRALDRFDVERDCVFKDFAAFWIHQALTRAVDNTGRLIRIPVHLLARLGKLEEVQDFDDIPNHGAEPELLRVEDVPEAELLRATAPDGHETPVEFNCDLSSHEFMMLALETLDSREKVVVTLRFGLDGFGAQTLEKIGTKYGLTRERIRQIEVLALKKLRQSTLTNTLRDIYGF